MQDLFGFIIQPLELGVIWLAVLVNSAGVGIILFTIFIRLLLAPLLITQLRSSRSMQRVSPLVQELRKKHGKDRKALSEATMALYKEHGVNPAMGCLPTLLQFPILIGLFYAFLHLGNAVPTKFPHDCSGYHVLSQTQWYDKCYAIKGAVGGTHKIYELFHAHFLWLNHGLGQPDPLLILPILAGASQWIQSRMMMQRSGDPQQQMMNNMMNFMPLMIVFFATRYASGLSLYWVTSTLIAVAIQYRITGWGLVPRPADLIARLTSSAPSRPRSAGGARASLTSKNSKASKAPRQPSQAPSTPETEAQAAVELNGQDGAKGGPRRKPAGTTPRKKANRAKGGRGGRRG